MQLAAAAREAIDSDRVDISRINLAELEWDARNKTREGEYFQLLADNPVGRAVMARMGRRAAATSWASVGQPRPTPLADGRA
ncbi:hypothetical protein [Peterkaempfera griseoplana]|uniref:hypothetical protein n=1 Tax=Peterkaempfera griseoplana TaxID=66896 RepID=UPI0006E21515|nr:hypothetical protein [Peterkaempfera griseoplana]